MLQTSDLFKSYGDQVVLKSINLQINDGDRLGLVGPNGCGKTTLLRILVGREQADRGSVTYQPPDLKIGYLEQALSFAQDATLGSVISGRLERAERQVTLLAERLSRAQGDELDRLLADYARALDHLESIDSHDIDSKTDVVLAGLGLDARDRDTPISILSGGQKTRLGLARLLIDRPALLLLDEPTNHLDIEALEWLERFLPDYGGAVLVVSHDRMFLNRTVSGIFEIDPLNHTINAYDGDYDTYIAAKERELERQWTSYRDQQDRIARYQRAITGFESYAKSIEHGTIDYAVRKIAKGIARKATVQKRRLERFLESEERVEKPKPTWQMKLDFVPTVPSSQNVILLEDVAMGFGDRLLFRDVSLTMRAGERIVLTGPNGSGKTTLLRGLMGELSPIHGSIALGPSVRVGYYSQEQEGLDDKADAFTEIRRVAAMSDTDTRSFLHYFLFSGDDVFVPIKALSFGERARLSLAKLVARGCNLLVLDEPINHLDIPSREQFEQGLQQFEGSVLAVVHDRYFIERFASRVWAIHDGTVRSYVDLDDMRRGIAGAAESSTVSSLPRSADDSIDC